MIYKIDFKKRAEGVIIKVWNPLGDKPVKQWMADNVEAFGRECYSAGMMRAAEIVEESDLEIHEWADIISSAIRSKAKESA